MERRSKRTLTSVYNSLDILNIGKRARSAPQRFEGESSQSPRSTRAESTNKRSLYKETDYTDSDDASESEEEIKPKRNLRPRNTWAFSSKDERSSESEEEEEESEEDDGESSGETAEKGANEKEEEDQDAEYIERILCRKTPKKSEDGNPPTVRNLESEDKILKKLAPPLPADFKETVYLVKLKERSYYDLEWLTAKEIEEQFNNGKQKLGKYLNGLSGKSTQEDENDDQGFFLFNPEFLRIDRIIDCTGTGEEEQYLVKWRNLSYDDCSWEFKKDLLEKIEEAQEKLDLYEKVNSKESRATAQKYKQRPTNKDFDEDLPLPTFRNENELKDYQQEGFRWLVHCWFQKRNTILADEMGLGKTIQAISILQYLFNEQQRSGPFIVVAPMSTIEQWKRELEEWTVMNVIVFHGSA